MVMIEPYIFVRLYQYWEKKNKIKNIYDMRVTLRLTRTPRGTRWRHQPSSKVKPKTDEEVKELREG